MAESRRVLLVGLGTIARTHLAALRRREDVAVVGGVDPDVRDSHPFPVFADLDAALATGLRPDLVVVATPTATHPAVVGRVLAATDARVLCEKPLAATLAGLRQLAAGQPALHDRVAVAHHFAFSPEVEWARRTVAAHPAWGPPTRITSVFNDAYGAVLDERRASLVSSWVDSGPNQLSILAGFVGGLEIEGHDDGTDRAVTALRHHGGVALLTSNWLAADTSKQTTLDLADGTRLRMDHTSMTGVVVEDGRITEHAGYTGGLSRKDAHYAGLYDVLLADPDDPRLGVALATDVARLLDDAAGAPRGGVRFASLGAAPE